MVVQHKEQAQLKPKLYCQQTHNLKKGLGAGEMA